MVTRRKIGQTNFLTLNRTSLRGLQDWLMRISLTGTENELTLENSAQYVSREQIKNKETK